MNILLLGKNGQVGWELQRSLAPLGTVTALDRAGGMSATGQPLCGDLSDLHGLAATVRHLRPDVIVNAAAHTAVDKAESEPELARALNALAPGVLAQEAAALGAWLVHYSTDYVFNGSGTQPWVETDPTGPLGVYGQTKLEGEQAIAASGCKHLILRTSWVYAARGGNFAKTMLKLAKERERLTVINDQFGAPTGADLIADVTAHAIRQVRRTGEGQGHEQGIYHLVASGQTTWFDYANHVLALDAKGKFAPHLAVKEVAPVPSSAFATAAKRPHNSRLSTEKLQSTFGLVLPAWQQGVDRMLAEIQ
ncbi:MAG: dTDP-4-dehydrorhamnose reductase [Burkholderiaceae bacterium]